MRRRTETLATRTTDNLLPRIRRRLRTRVALRSRRLRSATGVRDGKWLPAIRASHLFSR